jgi:hypothetical protein
MNSHAQVPRPIVLNDKLRVYFATREKPDSNNQFISRIGFADLDKYDPVRVLAVSQCPVLDVGGSGQFDEFGVMPGDISHVNGGLRLLYTGWSRSADVPYTTCIGEAFSDEQGLVFTRTQAEPVMGLTNKEPILCNGPFVIVKDQCEHMFYASAKQWIQHDGRSECLYVVMHASRVEGGEWNRDGIGCLPQLHDLECQNSPVVLFLDGRYHMFFCSRHALDFRNAERGYKLGYAWSEDLAVWQRDDGLFEMEGPEGAWENEMKCYPGIVQYDGRTLLFYCGNQFGRSGFGVAELSL